MFRKQINYIKSTTNEILPIFYSLYYSSAHPRSNPLGDKAMLKSCDYGMAYFDVLGNKIAVPFSKNQLTDHSSDLNDTVENSLNYYVVFFDWYVITLSFN